MDTASPKTRFAPHGYAGIAIIVGAEVLLFGGNQLVGHWFTPMVWTGYILFVDALVSKLKARSLLMTERVAISIRPSRLTIALMVAFGAVGALVPLIFPSVWYAPVVWLAFIFLLDPLNARRGWPSITGDLARGDWRRLWSLLASGLLCGGLWEFWNYWSLSKWTYTVPYFGNVKIFEMPV